MALILQSSVTFTQGHKESVVLFKILELAGKEHNPIMGVKLARVPFEASAHSVKAVSSMRNYYLLQIH